MINPEHEHSGTVRECRYAGYAEMPGMDMSDPRR
jgi:hypothetical protein